MQLEIAELTRLATRALAIESKSRRINVEMLVWQRARGRAKEMLKIVTCYSGRIATPPEGLCPAHGHATFRRPWHKHVEAAGTGSMDPVKLLVERGANVNEQAGEYLARIIFVRLLE